MGKITQTKSTWKRGKEGTDQIGSELQQSNDDAHKTKRRRTRSRSKSQESEPLQPSSGRNKQTEAKK